MQVNVYAVYDVRAKCYAQPFFCMNENVALRAWREAVNDPSTSFYKHPQDFSLFHIGYYDDWTGVLLPLPEHNGLGLAAQYKDTNV